MSEAAGLLAIPVTFFVKRVGVGAAATDPLYGESATGSTDWAVYAVVNAAVSLHPKTEFLTLQGDLPTADLHVWVPPAAALAWALGSGVPFTPTDMMEVSCVHGRFSVSKVTRDVWPLQDGTLVDSGWHCTGQTQPKGR